MLPPPPKSTLFPYTTLFRSRIPTCCGSSDTSASTRRALRRTWLARWTRSEEHTSELQSHHDLVCRLLLEKKKKRNNFTASADSRTQIEQNSISPFSTCLCRQ